MPQFLLYAMPPVLLPLRLKVHRTCSVKQGLNVASLAYATGSVCLLLMRLRFLVMAIRRREIMAQKNKEVFEMNHTVDSFRKRHDYKKVVWSGAEKIENI